MRLFMAFVLVSTSTALVAACGSEVDIPGSAGVSSDGACPAPNPGMCAPSPVCENGVVQTGEASCVNGAWVCGVAPCTPDAGPTDSGCEGNSVPACLGGKISSQCCPPGECSKSPFCDLGNGACVAGPCADAACMKSIHANDFDQSCGYDGDCKAVYDGDLCDNCICPNAAIAKSALTNYQAAVDALGPIVSTCDCPAFPPPFCDAGICVKKP